MCKKWFKKNPKMRLTALLFDPPRHAPHPNRSGDIIDHAPSIGPINNESAVKKLKFH
jgi:hypothetical protein